MSNNQIPPGPPNWSQLVEQNLLRMKKQTSQQKGETMDTLTEMIAENFKQFYQIGQQLTAQIDQRDKTILAMQKTIDEYESAHPELKIAREKKAKIPAQTKTK